MHDNPEIALSGVRGIVTRALSLIWEAELPRDLMIPGGWIQEWNQVQVNFPNDRGRLPLGDGAQCRLLQLLTGTAEARPQGRYVTKTTYLLVNHLKSVGDLGSHLNKSPESKVTVGFAASIVLAAISLVESLTADLHGEEKPSS